MKKRMIITVVAIIFVAQIALLGYTTYRMVSSEKTLKEVIGIHSYLAEDINKRQRVKNLNE